MKKSLLKVAVRGEEYPCRATMGAMLRFKHESGKEVTEINAGSMSDLVLWLWCCVVSACRADGVAFDLSLMDFADQLSPEIMKQWAESQHGGIEEAVAAPRQTEKKIVCAG